MIGPIFSFAKRVELKSQLIQGNKSIHSFWRREEFGMVSPLRIFIMYHGKKNTTKQNSFTISTTFLTPNGGAFLLMNQFTNSLNTSGYHTVHFWHHLELVQTSQIKGSISQDCSSLLMQSWVLYFCPTYYKLGIPTTPFLGLIIY